MRLGRNDPYAHFTVTLTVSVAGGNYKHSKRPPYASEAISEGSADVFIRETSHLVRKSRNGWFCTMGKGENYGEDRDPLNRGK